MKIDKLNELALIDSMRKSCPCALTVKKGIGDDTAVLPLSATEDMLFTTDMTVQGVHFTKDTSPLLIGRKALARNLSDIAAMGGVPTYAVISLGLLKDTKSTYVEQIYVGINKLAREFNVSIVGGDTVKSKKLVINIALLGKVAKGKAVLRVGAKVGDQIFVTGPLGGSFNSDRHLTFMPRLREGKQLLTDFQPTAMIDVSDGLAGDLGHILIESGVGAVLEAKKIPLNNNADLKAALYDGEDFELLFTLSPKKSRGCPYFLIGTITKDKGQLSLRDQHGKLRLLKAKGFTHF